MSRRTLLILTALIAVALLVPVYMKFFTGPPPEPPPQGPVLSATCKSCGHVTHVPQAMIRAMLKTDTPKPGTTIPCEKCGKPASLDAR